MEYEAENASHCSELVCMHDDAPLVDTLVDHLHVEWSKGDAHVLGQQQTDCKVVVKAVEVVSASVEGGVPKDDLCGAKKVDGVSNFNSCPEGKPLGKVYARLYELAENKLEIVAHMHVMGSGVNGEAW